MQRLTLEWRVLDADHVALVFDKKTWGLYQLTADAWGVDTGAMIAEAVAKLLGPTVRTSL